MGLSRPSAEDLKMFRLNNKGQGLTEYLILLLLISVASIVTVRTLGGTIKMKLQQAQNHINSDAVLR